MRRPFLATMIQLRLKKKIHGGEAKLGTIRSAIGLGKRDGSAYIRPTAISSTLSCRAKSVKPVQNFLAPLWTSSPARIKLSPLSRRPS